MTETAPRPRILVVEDEAIVARDLQLQLASLGYEPIAHAKRGEDAVQLAAELRPDLVLMDIQLAGAMNGIDAAARIRRHHAIPVVFLTAYAEDGTLEQAKLAEPFGYVLKPYAERELRIVLEIALYKHRMDSALRDSEDRYRSLVNNLQSGVVLLGARGEVLLANDRATELLGVDLAQLQSRLAHDPAWNVVREDGSPFPPGTHPVALCMATRRPVLDIVLGVFRPRTQDRLWLQVSANPRLDADGRLREIICTFGDITRRKHVELELIAGREALRESALHTQAILDNVVDAVITINRDGVIESFNRAATSIFGYRPVEVIGHNVALLMADHDRQHHDAYMRHHLDTGESRVIGKVREMQARRKDGQVFPISLAVSRIAHLGQMTYIGLIRDITERNRAAEALEEKSRQLRTLSRRVLEAQEMERRRVAHELHDELGQSLTAIKINLQARERFKDRSASELNAENLRIVEDALQHVRRLAVALRPSVLDDLGLIPALRGIAEQTGTRSGFEVHFQPAIPPTRLPPDIETACFRVVQEALTNITRHAHAQRVDIHLFHDGEALVLTIHDDGCGFDVAAVRERAAAGDSIGLLGMKERATLLGGQLDIESIPGLGSTVRMRCPLPLPQESP
ncbi:MAG: PAS domain S-box protein [Rhodoferax sp.]